MKKILALTLASVMMISSSLCVFASEDASSDSGSKSITADDIKKLEDKINSLTNEIEALTKAVKAKQTIVVNNNSGGGGSSSGGGSSTPAPSNSGNVVSYGSTTVYQGGKIEINGGRSNVTFTIKAPGGGTMTSATKLASNLKGSLVSCVTTSSPGASFATAKVNFFVSGVQPGDNIAVYQIQGNQWVQLPVAEIRTDHVVVNMTKHGTLAFVRVPVLASTTN